MGKYIIKSGFEVSFTKKNIVIDKGIATNSITSVDKIFPVTLLEIKNRNNIYISDLGNIYNSENINLNDTPISLAQNNSVAGKSIDKVIDDNYINGLITIKINELELENNIEVDTRIETIQEMSVISGSTITTNRLPVAVTSLYVEGLGELTLNSINNINNNIITLGDTSLNGKNIEVVYDILIEV